MLESPQEKLAKDIIQMLPENLGYKEFAQAIATILKDEYGSHNFSPFMEALHTELGMEKPLNEEAEDYSLVDDLAKKLKIKYPKLNFHSHYDRIDVEGSNEDKGAFADSERNTDFSGYKVFDTEDDDRGYIVRIIKKK